MRNCPLTLFEGVILSTGTGNDARAPSDSYFVQSDSARTMLSNAPTKLNENSVVECVRMAK